MGVLERLRSSAGLERVRVSSALGPAARLERRVRAAVRAGAGEHARRVHVSTGHWRQRLE